jgi:hypothetical protein
MKIHLAVAAPAVILEGILYRRMRDPVRSRGSRILARKGGKALMSKILYSHACKYYRRVIISPHDSIKL